jgi:phosphatidylserine decarboxylase precursor
MTKYTHTLIVAVLLVVAVVAFTHTQSPALAAKPNTAESPPQHELIVQELIDILNAHESDGWKRMLESSIKDAYDKAKAKLSPAQWDRYVTMPDGKKPVDINTLENYYLFLDSYVRWIPTERGHDEHVDEVLFQFARFYWILDQGSGLELQQKVGSREAKGNDFTRWMSKFANNWGEFLNTPASLTRESLLSYYDDPTFNIHEYIGSTYSADAKDRWNAAQPVWKSFNQFFARQTKPGLRPVAGAHNDHIINAPADFTLRMQARISDDSKITVKRTHEYNVVDLLDGSPYQDRFRNGLFVHGFLSTFDYHRFRAPVRGKVLESRTIEAEVYLGVDITNEKKFFVTDKTGYQFSQTRGLIIFESPVGLVAALPMGMSQVSSVHMTAEPGATLTKGEEFGYFMFGGSDIIILFEAGSNVNINAAPGIHTNAGMAIGEVIQSTD